MIVYRVPSTCVGSIRVVAGARLMLMLITVKMKPNATAVTTNSRAPGWVTRIRPKLTASTTAAIAAAAERNGRLGPVRGQRPQPLHDFAVGRGVDQDGAGAERRHVLPG